MICGQPLWLASALGKIEGYAHEIRNEPAEAAPATAHLFIINPLSGQGGDNLFSTHPNTENRVAALMAMAGEAARAPLRPGPRVGAAHARLRAAVPTLDHDRELHRDVEAVCRLVDAGAFEGC